MTQAMIISVDGHAALPLQDYRPYLDSKYLDAFDQSIALNGMVTTSFSDNLDPKIYAEWESMFFDSESGLIEGRRDPHRRVRDLQDEGIVAEVLFPDGAPFGAGGIGANRTKWEGELELAGARAYNRWMVEFVSAYPSRFAGQAIIVLSDIGEAVKDVFWAAENGLKGLVPPGVEGAVHPLWDPVYEPFWSACEETGLPLNFHGGVGTLPSYGPQIPEVPHFVRLRVQAFEAQWFAHRPLWWLIWSGVLERHPGLKLVFTEQHSDWIPEVLQRLDHSYEHSLFDDAIKTVVPRRPSEYWARQCSSGASILARVDLQSRNEIGPKNLMFGADFPHPEGTVLRNTLRYLQATVGSLGMMEDETLDFLGRNAQRVFGFDSGELEPYVSECGYDISDILTPLDPEYEADFYRTDVVRP